MNFWELLVVAVGLSLDAVAVAACRAACLKGVCLRQNLVMATSFGVFQGLMPAAGYLIGTWFGRGLEGIGHWLAFVLLALIGVKMAFEGFCGKQTDEKCGLIGFKEVLLLSVATSVDALAVGLAFAALRAQLVLSSAVIGAVTFLLSMAGASLGGRLGRRFGAKAQIAGGAALFGVGLRLLLEHA